MKYIRVDILTSDIGVEEITGVLLNFGIEQTIVDSPATANEILKKKNSYKWDYIDEKLLNLDFEPKVTFYLFDDEKGRELCKKIMERLQLLAKNDRSGLLGSLKTSKTVEDDELWKNSYKEHFKTIKLTDEIIVKPSWEKVPQGNTKKIIELDPGTAFGTGDHATTSMCAELMQKAGCAGKNILDIGTGSGILAFVADAFGAKNVLGVDIDDDAVAVAKENAQINHCKDNVKFVKGDLTKGINFEADIVVANLMAEMVIALTTSVKKHMKPNAVFISSGILVEKKEKVITALKEADFEICETLDRDGWSCIMAK